MPMNMNAATPGGVAGGFRFGQFWMRPDGMLLRDGVALPISKKGLSLLRVLVSRAGELVSAEELQRAGWGATHVTGDSLPRAISSLRSSLGVPDAIQSFYGRGYCFKLPVERVAVAEVVQMRERPTLPRLAVMPLMGAPGVPNGTGAGISETALLRLGRADAPGALIVARDSVFALCEKGLTAVETGRRVGADLVLCGFVRPLGAKYRLRLEMIRVADHVELWCEEFLVASSELRGAGATGAECLAARLSPYRRAQSAGQPATGVLERLAAEAEPGDGELVDQEVASFQMG